MAIAILGILAHVESGKADPTDHILFKTGTVAPLGGARQGSSHSDSIAWERTRGITSAVAPLCLSTPAAHPLNFPGHTFCSVPD
ncbi:MAG: GTP-binding protein, partial [Thermomicrobiales bacterium]